MAGTGEDRPGRRRRLWRRSALPRSRPAVALGAVLVVVVLVLVVLAVTRARPGRDVPPKDPAATTSTRPPGPAPVPPSITAVATTGPAGRPR